MTVRTPTANCRPVRRGRGRSAARIVVIVAAAGLAVLAIATSAASHAILLETTPADGADLDAAPAQVRLEFNEPVQVPTGGVRVFDGDAQRVDTGLAPRDNPAQVIVDLPADLPAGGYVVTWRVISADTHPVGGVFTFTVAGGDRVDDETVAALFAADRPVLTGAIMMMRAAGYAATLLAAGAVGWLVAVARQREHRADARRVAIFSAAGGSILSVAAVPLQAAAIGGVGLVVAVADPVLLTETMTTGFGLATAVRTLALATVALLAWGRLPDALVAIPGVGAISAYALDGHQRTGEPVWLLVSADVLHLAAAAIWLAGLVLLARALPSVDDPHTSAGLISRFSTLAAASLAAVAASGIAMSWALVRTPNALVTTSYGWTLLAKIGFVTIVVVIAGYNRIRLVPSVARTNDINGARNRLRRTVRAEAALIAAVLAITGVLVNLQPAADAAGQTGIFHTTIELSDTLDLDLVVEPNRAGVNTIHAYVLDAGRPADTATDLTFELTYLPQQIGPIPIEPYFAGTGHWIAVGDELAFPGQWRIDITVNEGRFTRHRTSSNLTVAAGP